MFCPKQVARNERGSQMVEWVGMAMALGLFVFALYAVFLNNHILRTGVTNMITRAAQTFGQNVAMRGPDLPERPIFETSGMLRVTLDPATGRYVAIDPESGMQYIVTPRPGVQVTVDQASGTVSLSDPSRYLTVLLRPVQNRASMIDHSTGVTRPLDLAELQRLGVVEVTTQ
jgi:hypothetical protein